MNCSGNLISLSDSATGQSLSTSVIYSTAVASGCVESEPSGNSTTSLEDTFFGRIGGTTVSNNAGNGECNEDGGSGVLIDFSDEVEVPLQEGILRQAEIDDTFGIFSMAQSSQGSGRSTDNGSQLIPDDDEDEAAKLVRSFTSGRKSVGVKNEKEIKKPDNQDKEMRVDGNDSVESAASDQPTIVESDDEFSPNPNPSGHGEAKNKTLDEKMDLTSSSNFSGGSDSEYLDVGNLSSFSIPDDGMDEFIEEIKKQDMASSTATKSVVNKIKLEILQGNDEEHSGSDSRNISIISMRSQREDGQYCLLSEMTRPSMASSTRSSLTSSRLSASSTVSTSNRGSTSTSSKKLTDVTVASSLSTDTSSIIGPSISTATKTTRARLSSSNFGSPIRASYPVSRYFMPTPKAKTPSAAATRGDYNRDRDRLSESLMSPSRTRVMLVTGDSHRSPSRAPVRKSISAETLHYEYNTPAKEAQRHKVKFSTPSATSKSRHSFSVQSGYPNFPNLFGDDRPVTAERQHVNIANPYIVTTKPENVDFVQHRGGRLSYASTASNSSIHTLSPTNSNSTTCADKELTYTKEMQTVTGQLNRFNLNDSCSSSINASTQPVRATAIIAPTNLSKPIIKLNATNSGQNTGLHLPSRPIGQQGLRPIAASSPNNVSSSNVGRPGSNQTTPTRSRYGINVRSSGYGAQQNLNSTFGANQPLKSPNKATSTSATIKPAAIPKSLKTGVPTLGNKLELGTRGGGTSTSKTGVTALKPGGKLPVPGSIGLRRPATSSSISSTANGDNKENKIRPGSTLATSRIGLRQPHRQ